MNPELRRNLWLELTPLRMLAAPFCLGLLFLVMASETGDDWRGMLFMTAHYVILIAAAFWGARKAADAVAVEQRERTWDQQRLSGLGPGTMALGKIFGAPSFIWVVIGWCLLAQLCVLLWPGAQASEADSYFRSELIYGFSLGWDALAAEIAGAFAVFATAFFAALAAQSGQERPRAFDATLFQLAGVTLGLLLTGMVSDQANLPVYSGEPRDVSWWGVSAPPGAMLAAMMLLFGLWAVYGAYHQLRRAFAMPTNALPWILFLGFLALFVAGWPQREPLVAVAVMLAAASYAAALVEPHKLVAYRLWLRDLARGDGMALLRAPAWIYAWIATAIAAAMMISALGAPIAESDLAKALRIAGSDKSMAPLAALLFVLRDMGLCVWAGLRAQDGRGLWTAALLLALLWIIAPTLAGQLGGAELFTPLTAASLLSAVVQGLVAWAVVALELRPERASAGAAAAA